MPRIHDTVVMTKERSEWPARDTLAALGVSKSRYYRWLAIANGTKERLPDKRFNTHELLPEEVGEAMRIWRCGREWVNGKPGRPRRGRGALPREFVRRFTPEWSWLAEKPDRRG